ncbi:MAG: phage tail assembly chaperone [Sphingobium sp.]|nr:phage tail assembly chaperone [Sphingobium sp.]
MSSTAEEGGPRHFSSVAARLAGLAGVYLGWGPDAFWAATPAEMEAIMRVMLGMDVEGHGTVPPSRNDIARLQEIFPDG